MTFWKLLLHDLLYINALYHSPDKMFYLIFGTRQCSIWRDNNSRKKLCSMQKWNIEYKLIKNVLSLCFVASVYTLLTRLVVFVCFKCLICFFVLKLKYFVKSVFAFLNLHTLLYKMLSMCFCWIKIWYRISLECNKQMIK